MSITTMISAIIRKTKEAVNKTTGEKIDVGFELLNVRTHYECLQTENKRLRQLAKIQTLAIDAARNHILGVIDFPTIKKEKEILGLLESSINLAENIEKEYFK